MMAVFYNSGHRFFSRCTGRIGGSVFLFYQTETTVFSIYLTVAILYVGNLYQWAYNLGYLHVCRLTVGSVFLTDPTVFFVAVIRISQWLLAVYFGFNSD